MLQYSLDLYVPKKLIHSKYSKRATPWFTPKILSDIHDKQKANHKAERSQDPIHIQHYKHLKNKLKVIIRAAKLHH